MLNVESASYSRVAVRNTDSSYVRRVDNDEEASGNKLDGEVSAEETKLTDTYTQSRTSSANRTAYKPNKALVSQLKAEQEKIQLRFLNTVKDMLTRQGKSVSGDGIWKLIASGDYKVDPDVQAEAQKNIAEDGYWGVEQTSDRIVKYATALTGGDPDKLDSMIEAFEKGYKAAEKAWGGTLPGIAQQTREAVLQKFEDLRDQYANSGVGA